MLCVCRIQMYLGLNNLDPNPEWSRCSTLHLHTVLSKIGLGLCDETVLISLFICFSLWYLPWSWSVNTVCEIWFMTNCLFRVSWGLGSLTVRVKPFVCSLLVMHIVHINMCLNLVSLRSVQSRKAGLKLLARCVCFPAQSSYTDSVKITFVRKGFVRFPTFLRPDVFCLICWDKSGSETPAGVTEREHELCLWLAARGRWSHAFRISSSFCCNGSVMYPIFPQRTAHFWAEARKHVMIRGLKLK